MNWNGYTFLRDTSLLADSRRESTVIRRQAEIPVKEKLFLLISRRSRIFWIGVNGPPLVLFPRRINRYTSCYFFFLRIFVFTNLPGFAASTDFTRTVICNRRCRYDNGVEVSIAEKNVSCCECGLRVHILWFCEHHKVCALLPGEFLHICYIATRKFWLLFTTTRCYIIFIWYSIREFLNFYFPRLRFLTSVGCLHLFELAYFILEVFYSFWNLESPVF